MFSIIISINGITKKTIPATKAEAYKLYKHYTSKDVLFEKRFFRKKSRIVNFDKTISLLDENGAVINTDVLKEEEKFKVYGINKRLTVEGLLKHIFLPKVHHICMVTSYNNKVLVDDMESIEIILCKNCEDAKRLMDYILIVIPKNIKGFLFLGEISYRNWKKQKNLLLEKTGINEKTLYRKTSR